MSLCAPAPKCPMCDDEEKPLIVSPDGHLTHEEWRERVQDYINAGDRGREPHFVGRDDLFERVDEMISGAAGRHRQGRTIVIGGAPGAGKTGFLAQLAERYAESCVVVEVTPDSLHPFGLFDAVADVLGEAAQEQEGSATGIELSGKAVLVEGKHTSSRTQTAPSDYEILGRSNEAPWRMLRERFGKQLEGKVVLMLCDETQSMERRPGLPAMLNSLHRGDQSPRGTPIGLVPVFAGLSNTRDVLRKRGLISRLTGGNERYIGALSDEESKSYALDTLAYLCARDSRTDLDLWAQWFVGNCDGWPHHLRTHMDAVAKAMLAADTPKLAALDRERIAKEASEARNRYYDDRLAATGQYPLRPAYLAMAEQANAAKNGLDRLELAQAALPHLSAKLRDDEPLDAFLDDALHAGIIQQTPESQGRFNCPVPSLVHWLRTCEHKVPLPPEARPVRA